MRNRTEKCLKLVHFGPYSFNLTNRELKQTGLPVELRPKASRFLQVLINARGETVPHDELYAAIWGNRVVQRLEGLHQLAKDSRQALSACKINPITNVPGVGYRFAGELLTESSLLDVAAVSARSAYLGGLATLPAAFVVYCLLVGTGIIE